MNQAKKRRKAIAKMSDTIVQIHTKMRAVSTAVPEFLGRKEGDGNMDKKETVLLYFWRKDPS